MTMEVQTKDTTHENVEKEVEALAADNQNQGTPNNAEFDTPKSMPKKEPILEQLRRLSINKDVDEMRKKAKNAIHIAGRMALAGQITVFYAGPNTGKTLISLKLISEAIANGTAGNNVYHLNLDDTYEGLITKADLGNRHGFEVISPSNFPYPDLNFAILVDLLVEEGLAGETVFILDTIKKFADVMDKKASSQFMSTCRKLTSAGGSIIALAHVNKNKDADDKGIPAGTSDILDDCDCAYIINLLGEEKVNDGVGRTVEFVLQKARGPVVQSSIYTYINYEDSDYNRMFNSVRLIDGNEADRIRAEKATQFELEKDQDLIQEVTALLNGAGELIQKDLVTALTTSGSFSRRKVMDCLKRWSCPVEEGGLWKVTKGDNNSNTYQLN